MTIFLALFIAASVWAQGALDRPRLGMMLDGSGHVRPVFGIAGSVTLGDPEGRDMISIACNRAWCLSKTRTAIVSEGHETDAPAGPALFAFARDSAWVYFPLVRQLAQWKNGRLDFVPVTVTGEILSLRALDGALQFAVRRSDGTWVVDAQNQVLDAIAASSGPVHLLDDGVLYGSPAEITLRWNDGSEIRFPLEGSKEFSALGGAYVQVRSGRTSYVIRAVRGHERMFQLPEPGP